MGLGLAIRHLERVFPFLAAQMRVREESPHDRILQKLEIGAHCDVGRACRQPQRTVEEVLSPTSRDAGSCANVMPIFVRSVATLPLVV